MSCASRSGDRQALERHPRARVVCPRGKTPRRAIERSRQTMLARVTTWEGGTADGIAAASEEMRSNVSQGPPPGVKSTGFTMIADGENGRVIMIGLFENADDLSESEAALKEMNPPEGLGSRTATDVYEVVADVRM
jgi:hypothetical protein